MKQTSVRGFRTFLIMWFSQLISFLGSGLTSFALGVWVYQKTGSATLFALVIFSAHLPGILVAPFAGALVDRWDRRWALILNDAGVGLSTGAIALLLWSGRLELWHIYVALAVGSVFHAFQWPAYSASMATLVAKKQLGRATGISQMGPASAMIVSPLLAGILIVKIGLKGVVLIDLATFVVAVLILLVIRIPRPETTEEGSQGRGSITKEAARGWTYIKGKPGLMGLLALFAITNFTMGALQVLFGPLVLSFASATVYGNVMATVSVGMLAGSIIMGAWGGPRRKVVGIAVAFGLQGVILLLGGFRPSAVLVSTAGFVFLCCTAIANGCNRAIWLRKVPHDIQGRVFAIHRMVTWSTLPLAHLICGPLAEYVFEPLMTADGPLAGSLGQVIGTGPGRGIGLFLLLLGMLMLLVVPVAFSAPRLRNVELEIPDAEKPRDDQEDEGAEAPAAADDVADGSASSGEGR